MDSWLEAISRALGVSVGQTLQFAGIPVSRLSGLVFRVTGAERASLSGATGISVSQIDSMTLSCYNGTAVEFDDQIGLDRCRFPFTIRGGSRFCPECLAETQGRWQLRWRLGWSFLCARHSCLLADVCESCGRRPRSNHWRMFAMPSRCWCGADLSSAGVTRVPRSHPTFLAQETILDIITRDCADFGVYARGARPANARSALSDVMVLTNRILTYASIHGFASVRPAGLSDFGGPVVLEVKNRPPRRRISTTLAPLRAFDTAVGVAAAMAILEASSVDLAAEAAAWLTQRRDFKIGPAAKRSSIREGSVALAILAKSNCAYFGSITELRWRTAAAVPRMPADSRKQLERMAAKLPTMLWPAWLLRFPVPKGIGRQQLGLTLAAATLLVGSTAGTSDIAESLSRHFNNGGWQSSLHILRDGPYWEHVSAAIIRLSEFLETHSTRIDYARRRELDYSGLLPEEVWREIRRDDPIDRREPNGWIVAQRYLIERVSGSPTRREDLIRCTQIPGNWLRDVRDFPISMTVKLSQSLDAEARRFLRSNRIREPVTWHPPLDLIDDLKFPRSTFEDMDPDQVHGFLWGSTRKPTTGQLAKRFGVDIFAIRFLLEQHPVGTEALTRLRTAHQGLVLRP
jgi:hypothetical protein